MVPAKGWAHPALLQGHLLTQAARSPHHTPSSSPKVMYNEVEMRFGALLYRTFGLCIQFYHLSLSEFSCFTEHLRPTSMVALPS